MFYAKKKKKKRKEERDIKYNEKDTFIPIFTDKRERWVIGGLTEVTLGRLSDNF